MTRTLKSILPTTEKDKDNLHPYSNSRLVDLNQCPIYGTVNAERTYSTNARAMALEAGGAMHEVFAAVRIWQLKHIQHLPKHADKCWSRLFNPERLAKIDEWLEVNPAIDPDDRTQLMNIAFAVLNTGSFYDDPFDSYRTIANMETAAIRYIDERLPLMHTWPIWCESQTNPNLKIGIEQTFDVTLHYHDGRKIRYIGTIDGLTLAKHYHNKPFLDENKTAIRLDEGWQKSFLMSHQITGYCAASTSVFGFPVLDAHIFGIKIKQGASGDNSFTTEVERTPESIIHWANWVRFTVEYLHEPYVNNFESAPRFTHSCNRYFRPCKLIPFCADDPEGRRLQYEQMAEQIASPSERAVMEQF